MTVIVLILLLLCYNGAKFADSGKLYEDYLEKENTTAIQGICVLLVFIRHYFEYVQLDGSFDAFAKAFNSSSGQLIVTMFLFYSGYGGMESIRRQGSAYVRKFPQKAIKLLLHFDIAIMLFLVTWKALGVSFPVKRIVLSLLAIDNVGNSVWYVFAVIILYIMSWISFSTCKKDNVISLLILSSLCVFYVFTMRVLKETTYYNTIMCYPLGMWVSLLKSSYTQKRIRALPHSISYLFVLLVCVLLFVYTNKNRADEWVYIGMSCCFSIIVVLITMKIRFSNSFLLFLGQHVFSIYIIQRIPMIILSRLGVLDKYPYSGFVMAFFATILFAVAFDCALVYFDRFVFRENVRYNGSQTKTVTRTPSFRLLVVVLLLVVISVWMTSAAGIGKRTVEITALDSKNPSSGNTQVYLQSIYTNNRTLKVPEPESGKWTWYNGNYCWFDGHDERADDGTTNSIVLKINPAKKSALNFFGNRWKGEAAVSTEGWKTVVDTYVETDEWEQVRLTLPELTLKQTFMYSVQPGVFFTACLFFMYFAYSAVERILAAIKEKSGRSHAEQT